jgi:hypothetical protein
MRTYRIIAILCCLLAVASPALSAQGHFFKVTRLPEWQGRAVEPHAMNDLGRVVGVVRGSEGPWHLFLWDRDSGVQDLGIVSSESCNINNKGQIVGTMPGPEGTMQAFLREPDGRVEFIGSPGRTSEARAINDREQVVGRVLVPRRGMYRAFIWDRTTGMRELGRPYTGGATAISDTGQIFGYITYQEGIRHRQRPCYWELTGSSSDSPTETPSRDFFGMNGKGWVVGKHVFAKGGPHVVLWCASAGMVKLFPYLDEDNAFVPSTCMVNDANQLVCIDEKRAPWPEQIDANASPERLCYFWDPTAGRIPLDEYLPAQTREFIVCDLNNRGCILGIARLEDGGRVPILLEPTHVAN